MVRYYEQQGPGTPAREANRYRVYDADAVDAVRRILLSAGLRTDIIRQVLPRAIGDDGPVRCAELRATLTRSRDLLSGFVARVQ